MEEDNKQPAESTEPKESPAEVPPFQTASTEKPPADAGVSHAPNTHHAYITPESMKELKRKVFKLNIIAVASMAAILLIILSIYSYGASQKTMEEVDNAANILMQLGFVFGLFMAFIFGSRASKLISYTVTAEKYDKQVNPNKAPSKALPAWSIVFIAILLIPLIIGAAWIVIPVMFLATPTFLRKYVTNPNGAIRGISTFLIYAIAIVGGFFAVMIPVLFFSIGLALKACSLSGNSKGCY
jgi:hypothetical protein